MSDPTTETTEDHDAIWAYLAPGTSPSHGPDIPYCLRRAQGRGRLGWEDVRIERHDHVGVYKALAVAQLLSIQLRQHGVTTRKQV